MTRIAVYTGAWLETLSVVAAKALTGPDDRLFFRAKKEVTYHIACDSLGTDFAFIERLPNGGSDESIDPDMIIGPLLVAFEGNNGVATVAPDDEAIEGSILPRATVWWCWTADFSGSV